MIPTTIPDALEGNLRSIGERNVEFAAALRATAPSTALEFVETPQGVPAAVLDGRPLCSRHRPLDEAARLAGQVDLVENAVVIVLGFGLGYHVQHLAEAMGRAGVIVVYEPDVAMLRTVLERIDHSAWLRDSLVVFIHDESDRSILGTVLHGAESVVAQGVAVVEHPASRTRLGDRSIRFTDRFSEYAEGVRATLMTTLVRSADTVRNLLLNIDHYAGGPGIEDLAGVAAGYPAVVVSAGPSLYHNIDQLAAPGVRDRCVIIAVQTTLKPLLERGIRPHFVTALDYHEISRRFYEGLDARDVEGVTLIADPKAHPVILDTFPGPVRCCAIPFLDKLLGEHARPMGELSAGATVAHLACYVAHHLGCNPITMIGQDLGFTAGLYYAPGTAIDAVWAPELNPFNTMEMMQWQRIIRHKLHLHRLKDHDGRTILTDTQMLAYLQQFERDFKAFSDAGVEVIDATEGGVAKQHVTTRPLADVLDQYANRPLPDFPAPPAEPGRDHLEQVARHVGTLRRDVVALQQTASRTVKLIDAMLRDQRDQARMQKHFARLERERGEVEKRFGAFELLTHLNQLGVFKRFRADRRLQMQKLEDPIAIQRGELMRDRENVRWIADVSGEFIDQLAGAERIARGEAVSTHSAPARRFVNHQLGDGRETAACVAALVPVDLDHSGAGRARSLDGVLQRTLERLGRSRHLTSIVLIGARASGADAIERLIDRARIALPVEIELVDDSPFPPEQAAIAAARAWAETSWRGGIGGMSAYDEVLSPVAMHEVMQRRSFTAALLVGPDWPLVNVTGAGGCDEVIDRHMEYPAGHRLVFTQSPPGLCGCVVSAPLMAELSDRNRLSTIGSLLVYQPRAPQGDPVARDANVQVSATVRGSFIRAIADRPMQRAWMTTAADTSEPDMVACVAALERAAAAAPDPLPRHVVLELTTERASTGFFATARRSPVRRPALDLDTLARLLEDLDGHDVLLTLDGSGDPLMHPDFPAIIQAIDASSVAHVHVRTELLDAADHLAILCGSTDVVSVDLHADRSATYDTMMAAGRFEEVLVAIDHVRKHRRLLSGDDPAAAIGLPWIVPRLMRCSHTYDDVETFFERWQHQLGTCVIEGLPGATSIEDALPAAVTPASVSRRELDRRMHVLSDGSVPVHETDRAGTKTAGTIGSAPLVDLWSRLRDARTASDRAPGLFAP